MTPEEIIVSLTAAERRAFLAFVLDVRSGISAHALMRIDPDCDVLLNVSNGIPENYLYVSFRRRDGRFAYTYVSERVLKLWVCGLDQAAEVAIRTSREDFGS